MMLRKRYDEYAQFDAPDLAANTHQGTRDQASNIETDSKPNAAPEGHCPFLFSFFIGEENYVPPGEFGDE